MIIFLRIDLVSIKMNLNVEFLSLCFLGICDFGSNCRFSHMTEEELFNLQRQVEGKL